MVCVAKVKKSVFGLFLFCAVGRFGVAADNTDTNNIPGRSEVHFTDVAPFAPQSEVMKRLGFRDQSPYLNYEITNEKFQVIVSKEYSTNTPWGLFVWISPSDTPGIPVAWDRELTRHHLLGVAAYRVGNNRVMLDRARLALDAVYNMTTRYNLDPKRIWISGFSGGSRVASILGVAYPDIFHGTLCQCGVDFYQNVPDGSGKYYLATYTPDPRALADAKASGRYVLLTGEKDINRPDTMNTYAHGFQAAGFANVSYLEVPGMKHALPAADDFKKALDYLDGK